MQVARQCILASNTALVTSTGWTFHNTSGIYTRPTGTDYLLRAREPPCLCFDGLESGFEAHSTLVGSMHASLALAFSLRALWQSQGMNPATDPHFMTPTYFLPTCASCWAGLGSRGTTSDTACLLCCQRIAARASRPAPV